MKKISSNLYTYIIFWIFIAIILSLSISYPLNIKLNQIYDQINQDQYIKNYKDIGEVIAKYQNIISKDNLTIQSMDCLNFLELQNQYEINVTQKIIPTKNHLNKYKSSYFTNRSMIFPLKFNDGLVYLTIESKNYNSNYKNIIALLTISLGLIIFLLVIYLSLRNILKYIKKIDNGISIIAGGALNYKLPLEGNNELTNLAHSINQMSSSLKENIETEKRIDSTQRKLLSNMSHDLRTPLTSILGYANIIADEKYTNKEELHSYINIIKEKGLQLQKLINDLFEYTKLSNKDIKLNIKQINLETFVSQYITSINKTIIIKNECQTTPMIYADIDLLKRILDNLFDNIRKYATEDSAIHISISDNNFIILKITNETDENLENDYKHIFDRMYVADSSRKNSASGLGLSIVYESMKLMNGQTSAYYKESNLSILLKFQQIHR